MSAGVVFMSHAVMYVPPIDATSSPYRSSTRRRSSPVGIDGTASTALPPPNGTPAIACLRVMAPASRITSARPSAGSAYTRIRVPPKAGPSRVECTPTNIHAPVGRS